MISAAYVKSRQYTLPASDPFLSFEASIFDISESIDNDIDEYYDTCKSYMIESEIVGFLDEDKQLYLESESKNVFEKIGEAVQKAIEKLIKFIKSIIDKIKNIGFKHKDTESKIKKFMDDCKKNNPALYKTMNEEVIAEFAASDLNFDAVKTITEIRNAYEEFLAIAKKKDADPNSVKAKCEATKKKIDSFFDKDKNTALKVAGAVTTVTGAITAAALLKSKLASAKEATVKANEAANKLNIEKVETYYKLKNSTDPKERELVDDRLTIAQQEKNCALYAVHAISKSTDIAFKIVNLLDNALTRKILEKRIAKSDEYYKKVQDMHSRIEREKQAEKDSETRKMQDEAYNRAIGQNKANREDHITHRDQDLRRARHEAYNKAMGQNSANIDFARNNAAVDNKTKNDSYWRQKGANEANKEDKPPKTPKPKKSKKNK